MDNGAGEAQLVTGKQDNLQAHRALAQQAYWIPSPSAFSVRYSEQQEINYITEDFLWYLVRF